VAERGLTTTWQRWVALIRPGLGVVLFALAAYLGWWWATPLVMFAIFVCVVMATHDTMHRSLGLSRSGNE
jgi:fatty acid desaturase